MHNNNYDNRDNSHRNNNFREREDGDKTQLFIARGRNDNLDQGALIDFIAGETQMDPTQISNVKILDAFSFFAVPNDQAGAILDHFQSKAGEGRSLVSKAKRKTNGGGDRGPRRDGGFRNDRREGGFGGGYGGNRDRNNDNRGNSFGNRSRRDDY